MKKIAPITLEQCIEDLRHISANVENNSTKELLESCYKYIEHQQQLLKRLYDSASKIDVEYCTILNNYELVPVWKDRLNSYHISKDYDEIWMEDFIAVEEFLRIE